MQLQVSRRRARAGSVDPYLQDFRQTTGMWSLRVRFPSLRRNDIPVVLRSRSARKSFQRYLKSRNIFGPMKEEPSFFNPYTEVLKHGNRLPHWQQAGATYFVTFRLQDSIPKTLLDKWHEDRVHWLANHPEPWNESVEEEYQSQFSNIHDSYLDRGHGECCLNDPILREIVSSALLHFDEERYLIHSFIIMPNHAHILFSLAEGTKLEQTIQAWKGFAAFRINLELKRSGRFWQKNYFDRMIRNQSHFFHSANYVRSNPGKARLDPLRVTLYESHIIEDLLGPT